MSAGKILWVGNLPGNIGGQNRVALFTIQELVKLGWDVTAAGKGVQVLDEGERMPCICYTFNEADPQQLYRIIDDVKPELILFSHDIWLYYFIPELKARYPLVQLVGWFTIDAHPIHSSWFQILRAMDYVCSPTQFGKETIYARWPERMVEVVKYGVADHYRLPACSTDDSR